MFLSTASAQSMRACWPLLKIERAEANRKLLDEFVPDKVPHDLLQTVLRLLQEQRVSVRNLPLVLQQKETISRGDERSSDCFRSGIPQQKAADASTPCRRAMLFVGQQGNNGYAVFGTNAIGLRTVSGRSPRASAASR